MDTKDSVLAELQSIFPQHNIKFITTIYNDVFELFGSQHKGVILPSCIDRILEKNNDDEILFSDNSDTDVVIIENADFIEAEVIESQTSPKKGNLKRKLLNDDIVSSNSKISKTECKCLSCSSKDATSSSSKCENSNVMITSGNTRNSFENSGNLNSTFLKAEKISNSSSNFTRTRNDILSSERTGNELLFDNISNFSKKAEVNHEDIRERRALPGEINTRPDKPVGNQVKVKEKQIEQEENFSYLLSGMLGFVEYSKKQIVAVIEDVQDEYLESQIKKFQAGLPVEAVVTSVVGTLLDNRDYPKKSDKPVPVSTSTITAEAEHTTYAAKERYRKDAKIMLLNSFNKISAKSIENIFSYCGQKYTKALKEIEKLRQEFPSTKSGESKIVRIKNKRSLRKMEDLDPTLKKEIETMEQEKKEAIEKGDHDAAMQLNLQQYEEEGQSIECGCCYGDAAFEDMVQCDEGHLFCSECLRRYSKEATFGEGKADLFCMTDGCDGIFPMSQLSKTLPKSILQKLFERQQDENIKLAKLENLVKCPTCDFAAEMSEGDKVFKCQNQSCLKETCRYCQEEWKGHFGLKCEEVEKKSVTDLRLSYEEKMTQAKVRECWQCKTIFLKTDGCNKMTCRCGAKMCYICRKPKIDYDHFCQHVREPGNPCSQCKKCSLWTDPSEDDDRAVAEIQKEGENEKKKLIGDRTEATTCATIGPKVDIKVQQNQLNIESVHLPPQQQFINVAAVYENRNLQVVNFARRQGRRRNRRRFRQFIEEHERQRQDEERLQQNQQQFQRLFQQQQDHHRQLMEQRREQERQQQQERQRQLMEQQQERQRQLMEQQRQEQERQRQAQDHLRQVQQMQLQEYRNINLDDTSSDDESDSDESEDSERDRNRYRYREARPDNSNDDSDGDDY